MDVNLTNNILAIVTLKGDEAKVDGGYAPVFMLKMKRNWNI